MSKPPELINIWIITHNTKDFPGQYVARRHEVSAQGMRPTEDRFVGFTLETCHQQMKSRAAQMGYLKLDRVSLPEGESPVIVEAWI